MSSLRKGLEKVEVGLKWDPSPIGSPPHDLDLVAATYTREDPQGAPAYVVHFDSRSPDGTIVLNRDSRNGQGFGFDEVMTLELERLGPQYARVVVGVVLQQNEQGAERPKAFWNVESTAVRIRAGYTDLSQHDLSAVAAHSATTVAEFTRDVDGEWSFHEVVRGFDGDLTAFTAAMGSL
ncbi:TerD family protein [Streptomyces sp. VRA16 Mangrove soil]|uniref:TerD family protein n=1 Tax=Streptomyces sp. VRA16 Mangrove soil TaxID=2817434 RepID=UPI001A9D8722|nr:TerD family protein [Streptomyces sp. VRA16 Mangrove soil]MBO1335797.1 TerD family protein [Streptomyces sp. VRA16 Mangrove soil]